MKNIAKIICILSLGIAFGKANAQSDSTFIYTGSMQAWSVPACVTQITVTVAGAQGGMGNGYSTFYGYTSDVGGMGGSASGTINVSPGQILYVYVGGYGIDGTSTPTYGTGGWNGGAAGYLYNNGSFLNGGGGGGGASDIRIGDTLLANRVVVGGGGGGGGCNYFLVTNYDQGGPGGASTGGAGYSDDIQGYFGYPGNGGTQAAGGTGGTFSGFCTANNGALGVGGADCNSAQNAGGGGGGGYYGGGGGVWSGGGGGSNYVGGLVSVTSNLQGTQTGNGSVIISWTTSVVPVTDTIKIISEVTCNAANNGMAYAKVTGGTPSTYTYSWAPSGQTTDTVTGLSAGSYTVTVNNTCGGSATSSVTITQPNVLTLAGNIISHVICNGQTNGSASAIVGGGTTPYTYVWTGGGGTKDTASGLSAGIYKVSIWDFNGCSNSVTVTITQPNVLTASAINTRNASCGISNGTASSAVGGGTAPYTYSWSGGATTSSISGLSGGTYMLNVMDHNGCNANSSVVISETPAVFASASTIANIVCNGDNIGAVLSNASGGVAPFTYSWTGGAGNNFSAADLGAGTYTVTITDINGCSSTAATTITEPAPLNVITDSTVDKGGCTGSAWVIVSGGVSPYTYAWSNGNTTFQVQGQCRGELCCTITDANGCVKNACIFVRSTTGIDNVNNDGSGITVYPNPNNGEFTIQSSVVSDQSSVEIYNVLGEKVYSQFSTFNAPLSINLSNQPNGIYLYRIVTENGDLVGDGKIILQK